MDFASIIVHIFNGPSRNRKLLKLIYLYRDETEATERLVKETKVVESS